MPHCRPQSLLCSAITGCFAFLGSSFPASISAQIPPKKEMRPEIRTLLKAGADAGRAGKLEDMEKLDQQALTQARELNDPVGEAEATRGLGDLAYLRKHWEESLHLYDQALALSRKIPYPEGIALFLYKSGLMELELGRTAKAEADYAEAVSLFRQQNNPLNFLYALEQLGLMQLQREALTQAAATYEEVVSIFPKVDNKRIKGTIYLRAGTLWNTLGNVRKGLEYFQSAAAIFGETGSKQDQAGTLNNIGVLYEDLGEYAQAMEYYQQALKIRLELGEKSWIARTYLSLGTLNTELKNSKKAVEFYEKSLSIFLETKDRVGEAASLANLGGEFRDAKDYAKSLTYLFRALAIQRELHKNTETAVELNSIGLTYSAKKDHRQALLYFNQCIALTRRINEIRIQAKALENAAQTERFRLRPAAALVYAQQAVALQEQYRTNLGGYSEAKTSSLALNIDAYYTYLHLLIELKKETQAFELAQKTKARSLLDLLTSGRVNLDSSLTPQERLQDQELRRKADALNARMVKEGVENEVGAKKRFAALQGQLKKTEDQLQTLTETLYARHPELVQKRIAKTASLDEVGKWLPDKTALLEYVTLAEDYFAVFVVTRHNGRPHLKTYSVKIQHSDLEKRCRALRKDCTNPKNAFQGEAEALYRVLIKPVEPELKGKMRLLICPDGVLWEVPFAVLLPNRTKKICLLNRFEVAYAHSATGAQFMLTSKARRKAAKNLLVCADPDFGTTARFGDPEGVSAQRPLDLPSRPLDSPARPLDTPARLIAASDRGGAISALPGTQREAKELQDLFPASLVLTGKKAQETTVKQSMGDYRFVHFATHGFVNDAAPLLSSVVLAQPEDAQEDGFLTAREISGLHLNAEMVVLSACNTARGENKEGEGIIGLTWALFVAGCPTQVVSQWSVDDASTAALMTSFYRNLILKKQRKSEALRNAALYLKEDGKHSHPYYWSPFILLGDPR